MREKSSFVRIESTGELRLNGISFARGLEVADSSLGRVYCEGTPSACTSELMINSCKVDRLHLRRQFTNSVDLSFSHCGVLDIAGDVPEKLVLTEFTFDRVALSTDNFEKLLDRTQPFSRSIFLFVENWLRARGRDSEATEVYLKMRRYERRHRKERRGLPRSLLRNLWNGILDSAIWLGLESHRLAAYFVLSIMISTVVFTTPGALVPKSEGKVGVDVQPNSARPIDGFWAAIQYNIPLVTVPAAEKWQASSQGIAGSPISYADFASIVRVLGWLAAPLFIAALTGVLKRVRQK